MRCVNLSLNNDTHIVVTYISTDDSLHVFANEAVHLVISILICVNPTIAVSISPSCKRILPFCKLHKPKRLGLLPLHLTHPTTRKETRCLLQIEIKYELTKHNWFKYQLIQLK